MLSDQIPYYILDLLQQAPSVQVEGLGRFEAIFHPAVVDVAAGRIKPPSMKADFQESNPEDHRFLSSYITYVSGAGQSVADEAIAAFVKRVHDETRDDQVCTIDGFGAFVRSATEGLRFTPDWDAFNLSFRGLEPLNLHEVNGKKEPGLPPDNFISSTKPVLTTFAPAEEFTEEDIEFKSTARPDIIRVEPRPGAELDQHTSRLWWLILISALALITILCTYLAWDILSNRNKLNDLRRAYPDNTSPAPKMDDAVVTVDSSPIEVNTIPLTDTMTKEEAVPAQAPANQPVVQPGADCYVVVGAFAEQANVDKMTERLTGLGYTHALLKGKTLTRVAIRTACDQKALQQVLHVARTSINPESWIY